MSSSNDIRQSFLDFFRSHAHAVLPSGPLVPPNDPTLMFANAGMVQFKEVFTGNAAAPAPRAATSQKCIRISGKHNDLENVGVTARHHTFFEMLGNFSFGDYFKQDAIRLAWQFLTETMGLEPERLLVTVFGGEQGIAADDEAAEMWRAETGFGPERIVRCGLEDNFWQMGETGPCGPCSELHYYLGEGPVDPGTFGDEPRADGTGWFEVWNLVFMQFDRSGAGELRPLPAPCIDTGMGLERLAVIKQGVTSNYDTDVLRPIVDLAADISGKPYRRTQEPDDISMRVIADHARATAFLIAEGIFPDRDGRAYVLRRVMRRAIRHGHRLGIERLFLHECAERVVEIMGEAYPELVEHRALISDVTRQEETRFRETLRRGMDLLLESDAPWRKGSNPSLPGALAFKLYDTYGFPLDLQEVIGKEHRFAIDREGFDVEMARARERSAGSKVGDEAKRAIYQELTQSLDAVEFTGYDRLNDRGRVVALVLDGECVRKVASGQSAEVVVSRTPFYGESGGQVGDRGLIRTGSALFRVHDTVKADQGLVLHRGTVEQGTLEVGADIELEVDSELRAATRRNHSATHLLHWALRQVIGPQAVQKGSLVGPQRLRFDYSGSRPLESSEVVAIEDLVNRAVLHNTAVVTEVLPMDEAKARGAIGIFEEKYGEVVRMLRIGESLELCGGTHVARTGDIGLFKVLSESGLAAGVRRIEAATGLNALSSLRALENTLGKAAQALKTSPEHVAERAEKLVERQRDLGRQLDALKQQLARGGAADLTREVREISGVRVLGAEVEMLDPGGLRELADRLRDKLAPAVVLLGCRTKDNKALLVCTVSRDLTSRYKAGALVREAAAVVGGSGGGRPDFAQAGGSDATKVSEAVARVYPLVEATAG